jgi:hypothetical protein
MNSQPNFPDSLSRYIQPSCFAFWLFIYLFVHYGLRVFFTDALQVDDVEQLYHSQGFQLDYGNFQPPLYTWILWLLWKFVDPSFAALYLVRYLIIGLSFWLWYRVSLLLFKDAGWQFVVATSWLLLFELGWKLHQGSTHTTLLTLALIGSLHAMVLIVQRGEFRNYAYLAFMMVIGIMSKYSFAGFVVLTLISALLVPQMRERVLSLKMLFAIVVAFALSFPVIYSLLSATQGIDQRLVAEWGGSASVSDLSYLDLAKDVIRANIAFLVPLVVFVLGFVVKKARFTHDAFTQFFTWFFASYAVLSVAYVIFGLGSEMKQRWLHPFLIFTPFFLMLLFQQVEQPRRGWRLYQSGLIIFTVLVLVIRVIQSFGSPYLSEKAHRSSWPILGALGALPEEVKYSKQLCFTDRFAKEHFRLINNDAEVKVGSCFKGADFVIEAGLSIDLKESLETQYCDELNSDREVLIDKGSASYRVRWAKCGVLNTK